MDNEIPESSVIDSIKIKFPNRSVSRVAMTHGTDEHVFVLTSPVREEWKKYRREMVSAGSDIEKLEQAIEYAALAQIRWPERDEVRALFDRKPGIIQNFADELNKLSGTHVEVSTKKL